jgi:hypothetical protein
MNGSGTTMLLDCLANHSQLYGFPGETKVLPYFIGRQHRYGDLADDKNFLRLWNDLRRAVGGKGWRRAQSTSLFCNWGNSPRNVAAIFDSVMSALAAEEGKQTWCEKTPMYVHHIHILAREFPRAKFIHVIRDGRDCAASFHRRWRFNPRRSAFRWKSAVQSGRTEGATLGSRYIEIRYENVTDMPEISFQNICRFLGVPFEPEILKPARVRPSMSGSTAKSVTPNERKAEQYFDPTTLAKVESIAGRQLNDLGYHTCFHAGDENPSKQLLLWWEFGDNCRRLKSALGMMTAFRQPGRLDYIARRIQGAVRQKSSLS